MATVLDTRDGNFYNSGVDAKSCDIWRDSLSVSTGREACGKLKETDFRKGVPKPRESTALRINGI